MNWAQHLTAAQNHVNYAATREDFDERTLSETGAQTEALCAIAHALIALSLKQH